MKHSSQMDKLYAAAHVQSKKEPQLASKWAVRKRFLKEPLNFFGITRTALVFHSFEECADKLMRVKRLFKCSGEFVSADRHAEFLKLVSDSTHQSPTYWRDEAYAEMKSKGTKLRKVDAAFVKVQNLTLEIPELANELGEARKSINWVFDFMTMSRCKMALLSKEQYNEKVSMVNENLAKLEEILTSVQKKLGRRIGFPCDVSKILLKQRHDT